MKASVTSYRDRFSAAQAQAKRVDKVEAKDKPPKTWDSYITKRQKQVDQQSNGHAKVGSI